MNLILVTDVKSNNGRVELEINSNRARRHSSRMRTDCCSGLHSGRGVYPGPPLPGIPLERPGTKDTHPPHRQNDRHMWKHYLPATSLAVDNNQITVTTKINFIKLEKIKACVMNDISYQKFGPSNATIFEVSCWPYMNGLFLAIEKCGAGVFHNELSHLWQRFVPKSFLGTWSD